MFPRPRTMTRKLSVAGPTTQSLSSNPTNLAVRRPRQQAKVMKSQFSTAPTLRIFPMIALELLAASLRPRATVALLVAVVVQLLATAAQLPATAASPLARGVRLVVGTVQAHVTTILVIQSSAAEAQPPRPSFARATAIRVAETRDLRPTSASDPVATRVLALVHGRRRIDATVESPAHAATTAIGRPSVTTATSARSAMMMCAGPPRSASTATVRTRTRCRRKADKRGNTILGRRRRDEKRQFMKILLEIGGRKIQRRLCGSLLSPKHLPRQAPRLRGWRTG